MEVLYRSCCGIDVHKQFLVACLLFVDEKGQPSLEKSTEVLLLARQQRYTLSTHQLVRWHRAGLLPRPMLSPLKGASSSSWP